MRKRPIQSVFTYNDYRQIVRHDVLLQTTVSENERKTNTIQGAVVKAIVLSLCVKSTAMNT